MTDITAFPSVQDVLVSGDNIREFTATEAVTQGQVVGFAATGVSNAVVPMDATAGEHAVGVAIKSADAAAKVKVAMAGCVVKMINYDDTTAIDAGAYVEQNDNAVLGTVGEYDPAAMSQAVDEAGSATFTISSALHGIVGIAEEDIAGGSNGNVRIIPSLAIESASA